MYPTNDEDVDLLAALCFDQSNGAEGPYESIFADFGSSGVNLQAQQEQVCNIEAPLDSFSRNFPQVCSIRGEINDLGPYDGVLYNRSIGSAELDLGASFSGVLQQEPHQVRGNNDSATHVQQEPQQLCSGIVEINSSSSVGTVKQEQEHLEEECSRKRRRTGSCSKPGSKACREKLRREKLNDRFMDLSAVLEPGRTPKTDKSAVIDDAIRVVNQLRGHTHELKETNQKLLEEIKSLKAEKNELREEKLVLKADKEKMEQQMKSMAVPSPSLMPSHPAAAFHPNKMAVYPNFGYYPNMPMWAHMRPVDRDTSHGPDTPPLA